MAKKKSSKPKDSEGAKEISRTSLPAELEARLRAVWPKVGHLVEWCDGCAAWIAMFCAEARPYRETFYWESVAQMVADYLAEHPTASAEEVLTDCLIATQSAASAVEIWAMWRRVPYLFASSMAAHTATFSDSGGRMSE